jgi:hypothetical protein
MNGSGSVRFVGSVAAVSGRNGIAVRASFWVPEKSADALIELGADDVFEFAGLGVGLGIIDGEGVFEKTLCQAMTAHHIASAAITSLGEIDGGVAHLDEF